MFCTHRSGPTPHAQPIVAHIAGTTQPRPFPAAGSSRVQLLEREDAKESILYKGGSLQAYRLDTR